MIRGIVSVHIAPQFELSGIWVILEEVTQTQQPLGDKQDVIGPHA
jgi:hypothetical protein